MWRRRTGFFASWLGLFLLAASVLSLLACSRSPAIFQQESFVFGTQVQVTIAGGDEARAQATMRAVLAEFDRLHRLLHAWQPSAITELNDAIAAGRAHQPPAEVFALLQEAQQIARDSDGLFDPGMGRLIALWGFHGDEFKPQRPDANALQALRDQHPSIRDLKLNAGTVTSGNRAVAIDLGGYAKGVALDRAVAILKREGVGNALVNIGGNVMALGSKGGAPWKVGIRDPRGSGYLATIDLLDGEAVGTSGDYQRCFELDGRRYSHLLDPRTGAPAQGTAAVTILVNGPAAGMRSDALSKPLFLAGELQWKAVANRMGLTRVLRVDVSGRVDALPDISSRLKDQRPVSGQSLSCPK